MPTTIAPMLVTPAERTVGYAEALLKDIPEDRFGHMPHPTMNHPAFVLGHLSLYPERILNVLGRGDLVSEMPGWDKLFAAGCPCVEQDGRYPAKSVLVDRFVSRSRAVIAVVAATDDAHFLKPNPLEGRMRELFPTVGIAVNFLLNNHAMMHLGQISAWRRAIGLGSAM